MPWYLIPAVGDRSVRGGHGEEAIWDAFATVAVEAEQVAGDKLKEGRELLLVCTTLKRFAASQPKMPHLAPF